MIRISRDEMLMEHAQVTAKRSTCSRLQVGAVYSRDGRIIVTGYNGTPKGRPHCRHECDCKPPYPGGHLKNCASTLPCTLASHAERNGIDFAAYHGLRLWGTELHVTHMPCITCAGSILNVGVHRVVYLEPYRLTDGVQLLASAGVEVLSFDGLGH